MKKLMQVLKKIAPLLVLSTVGHATLAAAEPGEKVNFSEVERDILAAAIGAHETLDVLGQPSTRVTYAAVEEEDADSTTFRYVITRCGFSGCLPWKEMRVIRTLSEDGRNSYRTELGEPQPLPFHPQSEALVGAITALLRTPAAAKIAAGSYVLDAGANINGEDAAFWLQIAHAPHATGSSAWLGLKGPTSAYNGAWTYSVTPLF